MRTDQHDHSGYPCGLFLTPGRPVYAPYKILNINDLKLVVNIYNHSLSLPCIVAGNATGR